MKRLLIALACLPLTACDEYIYEDLVNFDNYAVDYLWDGACDNFRTEYTDLFFKCWAIKYGYMEIEGFKIELFREYITFFLLAIGTQASLKLLLDLKKTNFDI